MGVSWCDKALLDCIAGYSIRVSRPSALGILRARSKESSLLLSGAADDLITEGSG